MKPYGLSKSDNLRCPYGCCFGPKCARKYRRYQPEPTASTARQPKKTARQASKKQIAEETSSIPR